MTKYERAREILLAFRRDRRNPEPMVFYNSYVNFRSLKLVWLLWPSQRAARAKARRLHEQLAALADYWDEGSHGGMIYGFRKKGSSGSSRRPVTKLYTESEVQGRGRRFWFESRGEARAFCLQKEAAGYRPVPDGRTVWVPFSKRVGDAVREQRAGRDPE